MTKPETKYFDPKHNRLVYISAPATSEFWDNQWASSDIKNRVENVFNPTITRKTKRYLPKGSQIVEGGCGLGQYVHLLNKAGFKVTGVDFAFKTVQKLQAIYPQLDIRFDDLTDLSFENSKFDGYWSFGVIEHFYNGYQPIAAEMKRVLKTGGYLFMTVPTMSWLRKNLAKNGHYLIYEERADLKENFYQFALDPYVIVKDFESLGFELCEMKPLGGLKGLKDEINFGKTFLQKIFDSQNLIVKILKKFLDFCFEPFASHTTLFVFRKK